MSLYNIFKNLVFLFSFYLIHGPGTRVCLNSTVLHPLQCTVFYFLKLNALKAPSGIPVLIKNVQKRARLPSTCTIKTTVCAILSSQYGISVLLQVPTFPTLSP